MSALVLKCVYTFVHTCNSEAMFNSLSVLQLENVALELDKPSSPLLTAPSDTGEHPAHYSVSLRCVYYYHYCSPQRNVDSFPCDTLYSFSCSVQMTYTLTLKS